MTIEEKVNRGYGLLCTLYEGDHWKAGIDEKTILVNCETPIIQLFGSYESAKILLSSQCRRPFFDLDMERYGFTADTKKEREELSYRWLDVIRNGAQIDLDPFIRRIAEFYNFDIQFINGQWVITKFVKGCHFYWKSNSNSVDEFLEEAKDFFLQFGRQNPQSTLTYIQSGGKIDETY